jgi:thiol-disulfide isomerase/thioredoxin
MKKLSKYFLFFLMILCFNTKAQDIQKWKLNDLTSAIKNAEVPTIFNFWATFCKPCIEEIPYFQELVKKYEAEGVKLVLVSLDLPEAYPKIKSFAAKRKFTAPIVFLEETNADVFCPAVDEKWSGVIPASLFINNKTGHRKFFEDQLSKDQLEKHIQELVGKAQ